MAKKKEMTIDDLMRVLDQGFGNIQKQIDDLNLMTGRGFNDVQSQINSLAFEQKEFRSESSEKFSKLEKDMTWVKDILEAHTKMLKDLDEEKVFVVHRTDRIENDVEILKKHLKIA